MGRRPDGPVRWSVNHAANEFDIDRRTLTKRLMSMGHQPDRKDTYSTRQIADAVFGDIDKVKLRLANEQADKLAIENEVSRGTLISVDDAAALNRRIAAAIKQKILGAGIPEADQNRILGEIQRLATVDFTKAGDEDHRGD